LLKFHKIQPYIKLFLFIGLISLTAGSVFLLFIYNPSENPLFPPCPFHQLTGLHCPGCGSLRALHQLFHANLIAALDLNCLMVLSLPFVGYGLLAQGLRYFFNLKIPVIFLRAYWIWMIFVLFVVYGVVRNIPISPFFYLAP
jgi:hypothetical protein